VKCKPISVTIVSAVLDSSGALDQNHTVACDYNGLDDRICYRRHNGKVFLYAFVT
jgi:hypothetical protein